MMFERSLNKCLERDRIDSNATIAATLSSSSTTSSSSTKRITSSSSSSNQTSKQRHSNNDNDDENDVDNDDNQQINEGDDNEDDDATFAPRSRTALLRFVVDRLADGAVGATPQLVSRIAVSEAT